MKSNVLNLWDDIEMLRKGVFPHPRFVDFHTSDRCNQKCIGCACHGHTTNMMWESDHFRIVDRFLSLGVRAFDFSGGGEPTLLPYLPELLNHIRSAGAWSGVITNGMTIKKKLVESIVKSCTYVRVSLEASSRLEYVRYKKVHKNVWDVVLSNVQDLIDARDEHKSNCEVSLKFSVGKHLRGHDHYERICELCHSLKPDRVFIKALRHEPEELPSEERRVEAEILAMNTQWFPRNVQIHQSIRPTDPSTIPQCWLNPLHTTVDHEGNCYLCCYYYYRQEEHFIGNMLKQGFEDFWGSPEHKAKVKEIKRGDCAKVDCKFFGHHEVVKQALENGRAFFL